MDKTKLAKAIREKAKEMRTRNLGDADSDELIFVLARVVEGKSLDRAFGAPGDWGYDTPIGDALAAEE